jgi:hypothetical protein
MSTRFISFAEIIADRDADVRITHDNMIYAVDLVMVMTGKNRDDAGKAIRNISDETFQSVKFTDRRLPGKGNAHTKLVSFKDALELVMVLPGRIAKETRTKFAGIIQRYMAGDESLVREVEANAQSDAPIQQMARASLAAEAAQAMAVDPAPDAQALSRKRRIEELEIEKMELAITISRREAELQHTISRREAELQHTISRREAELDYATKITSTYRELCQDTVMDTRARLMFKDYYLNLVIPHTQQQAIAAADGSSQPTQPLPPPSRPISLSQVAVQMGLKIPTNDLISLGGTLRKRYEALHGKAPSKHEQLCDGRMTKVNSYFEADRPLVEEVLRTWNV